LPPAQEKALGLLDPNNSGSDGTATFDDAPNLFDYNDADGVAANEYDFFGVVAHEFSEIMGRTMRVGQTVGSGPTASPNSYSLFDLYHYSANGVRVLTNSPGYFSLDGGKTNLQTLHSGNGDVGDWADAVPDDSFGTAFP
jgi:hypothetical protein